MTALHWSEHLLALGACLEAVAWARAQPDLPTAWQRCENGAWMLWLAGKSAGEPWSDARRPLVLAVCGCVRLGLPEWRRHFPDDDRPLQLLETAESWARGTGATPEHVRAAASAAAASAAAAYAADAYAADARVYKAVSKKLQPLAEAQDQRAIELLERLIIVTDPKGGRG